MFFLVALIVTVILLIVLWRALGPDQPSLGGTARPRPQRRPQPPRRRQQLPPDDNPDFLRDLDRRARPEE
ncbi:MAG: hypothetical protein H0V64_00825 [Geodermatophilaceae bacterium]|nr:hypothetical protein [Geodermatophilaceae bacterium]MDQ3465588.1 hypothetical protein [Actinomycetota bacterium]